MEKTSIVIFTEDRFWAARDALVARFPGQVSEAACNIFKALFNDHLPSSKLANITEGEIGTEADILPPTELETLADEYDLAICGLQHAEEELSDLRERINEAGYSMNAVKRARKRLNAA